MKRCRSTSGLLFGFRCELPRGHHGPHEAITSRTVTERFGKEVETGRTVTRWCLPEQQDAEQAEGGDPA